MFKRKIALASLCVGLFSSQAFSEGFFIGTEMGVFHSSGKNTYENRATATIQNQSLPITLIRTHKGKDTIFNPSIKLGYVINELNRVYGLYSYNAKFDKDDAFFSMPLHKFALAYELTPQIYGNFRGVVGFNFGYATGKHQGKMYKETNTYAGNTGTATMNYQDFSKRNNGFFYGAKAGVLYELDSNSEIEFGFKAERILFKNKEQQVRADLVGNTAPAPAITIPAMTRNQPEFTNYGAYIGYSYKF